MDHESSREGINTLLSRATENFNNSTLVYLESFNQILKKDPPTDALNFDVVLSLFLRHGWNGILNKYSYSDSVPDLNKGRNAKFRVAFPIEQGTVTGRIEPAFLNYVDNMPITLGDFMIKTAWIHGLSPRLICLYPNGESGKEEIIFKFVKTSRLPVKAYLAPSLLSLDKTLLPLGPTFCSINKPAGRGVPLRDLINDLMQPGKPFEYFNEKIKTHPALKNQFVRLQLKTKSLVEILDAISYCLDAVWEWVDQDKIYIAPRLGSGEFIDGKVN